MEEELRIASDILKKNSQEHLLDFYDELTDLEKKSLIQQIVSTDFSKMNLLLENSKKDDSINPTRISPIPYSIKANFTNTEVSNFCSIGEKALRKGEVAVITLAGGQGTRLGYKGPKGSYEIDVPPKKSLFEFTCDKLIEASKKYGSYLPWYIMTSPSNDKQTKAFFEMKNYFGYPSNKIFFFKQNVLPIIDVNGKVILDNIYTIKEASNGNGDVFKSFNTYHLVETLLYQNIKWISIAGIDNIILDIIDPLFLGLTISNESSVASKSIRKADINSSEWIFANVDNRPCIISPTNLTEEMKQLQDNNGNYCYNQINILAHLFSTDAFIKMINVDLPYHRAFKKNDFINGEGMKVVPSSPNSFKFEKFIFDAFKFFDNFTLLEVNANDEFAPIKSFSGNATPETALDLYLNKKHSHF